jgi:hypothetical protein
MSTSQAARTRISASELRAQIEGRVLGPDDEG